MALICETCKQETDRLQNGTCRNCNPGLNAFYKSLEKNEEKRKKLYWALRSRVLTNEEMQEVERLGIQLVIGLHQSYFEQEKIEELNKALLQQFKIRLEIEKVNNKGE